VRQVGSYLLDRPHTLDLHILDVEETGVCHATSQKRFGLGHVQALDNPVLVWTEGGAEGLGRFWMLRDDQ